MKVIFMQLYEVGTYIHAAQLELMEKHCRDGDEVIVYTCSNELCGCDYNPYQHKLKCLNCKYQFKRAIKLISEVKVVKVGDYLCDEEIGKIENELEGLLIEHASLRKKKIDNYDIGEAILSTLISRHRDPNVDPVLKKDHTLALARAGLHVYYSLKNLIKKEEAGLCYIFNGRHVQQRAARRACEKMNVRYLSVESGPTLDKYALYENTTPHDIGFNTKEMNKFWKKNPVEGAQKAHKFFQSRINSIEDSRVNKSYTKNQDEGLLPDCWSDKNHNVVFYCNSDDEFAAVGDDFILELYDTQLHGLQRLLDDLEKVDNNCRFYVRVHPNLEGIENDFTRGIEKLKGKNFVVIPADSKISTYKLMREANVVVTFSSTAGVEAAYLETPSVILGNSFYKTTGCVYTPRSHEEAFDLIMSPLPPLPIEGALKYAYHRSNFGIKYEIAEVGKSDTDFSFKGTHLNGSKFHRTLKSLVNKIKK